MEGGRRGREGARGQSYGGHHHSQHSFSSCYSQVPVLKVIRTLVKDNKEDFIQETSAFSKGKWEFIAKEQDEEGERWKITKRRHWDKGGFWPKQLDRILAADRPV